MVTAVLTLSTLAVVEIAIQLKKDNSIDISGINNNDKLFISARHNGDTSNCRVSKSACILAIKALPVTADW